MDNAMENGPISGRDALPDGVPAGGHPELPPDLDFPADPELAAQGWQRRFMANAGRAREARELYGEMGFEVRLEPIKMSQLSEVCGDCRVATCLAYVNVYTRKIKRSG